MLLTSEVYVYNQFTTYSREGAIYFERKSGPLFLVQLHQRSAPIAEVGTSVTGVSRSRGSIDPSGTMKNMWLERLAARSLNRKPRARESVLNEHCSLDDTPMEAWTRQPKQRSGPPPQVEQDLDDR
jgi:hypothetical protein